MAYFTQNAGMVNGPNQQPNNKPEAERATNAEYQVRPQSRAEKFKNAFLPQDWATAARTGFVRTFVPGIKNLVLQGLVATFTGMLYGGGQAPPTNFQQPGGYIHYGGMYQNGYPNQYYGYSNAQAQQPVQQAPPRRPEYNQVVLPSGEMDKVKAKMLAYFNEYTWCSLGCFYDFCGITCEAPDRNFGWTYDQINASIVTHSHKDANGVDWFYLNIARPTPIRH